MEQVEIAQPRTTRRHLIGGVVTTGAACALAAPLLDASARPAGRPCTPSLPGTPAGALALSPGHRTVWVADTRASTITAHHLRGLLAGRSIDVGATPLGLAISPRGDLALVSTAFYDRPGLTLVDLPSGDRDRVDAGEAPGAVVVSPSGRRAYVVGAGAHGTLTRVDLPGGRVHAALALGAHPLGIALTPDATHALVALNGAAALALVDLKAMRVAYEIATPDFPAQVAIAPDGLSALCTHNGYGARAVTRIDLRRHRAGRPIRVGGDPAGLAYSRGGRTAIVTSAASGAVALIDTRSGRRRRTVKTGPQPRAVVVAGRRAIVADAQTGALTAIALGAR